MIDLRDHRLNAAEVIRALDLQPHPEGGHYRETWRDRPADGGRGAGTAILFLLRDDELSDWHRVDADELWIWQAGAHLVLTTSADGHDAEARHLGPDLGMRQSLQLLVPRGHWQSAVSLGRWTLVSCVVAPAFRFEGFELAPPDWRPVPRD
ncbi:cupin domain-containing protein [Lichenicola sp.]|uniref:cupin domain-containing protein n=1 Tax=Lichenicola sp. TaxID=2804529 RepID=UPI003B00A53C